MKFLSESPLWKALETRQAKLTQKSRNKRAVFWEEARPQSMGAGRANPTGACTTETKQKERYFKDEETATREQANHKITSANQGQPASSKSSSGWGTALKIPDCMERNEPRSLGNGSNFTRIPLRISQNPTHQVELPDFLPLSSASHSNGPGSTRSPQQGSDRNMSRFGWFLQPNICGPQKGGRVAADHKSKGSKSVPQYPTLQNGEYLHPQRYFKTGRLHGKNRFKGCIFQRQNSSFPQEIPEISMERNLVPVQGSAIWSSYSSQSFLKDHAGSSEATAGEGNTASTISRRHTHPCQLPESTERAYQNGSAMSRDIRLHSQQEKVCIRTCPAYRVSRLPGGFPSDEDFLPTKKVRDIAKQCRKLLWAKIVSAHSLAHLIGKMTATIPAIFPAALHYRALQRLKNRILWRNKQNYSATAILDEESKRDLKWWTSQLPIHNGRMLITPPVKLTIESDASTKGWGAYCQGLRAGGPWRVMENSQHINILELKSAFLALQTFAATKHNMHILLRIDNRTAIAYINQKGGTHSKPLSDMARRMWNWCLEKGLTVQAEHIAGVENT